METNIIIGRQPILDLHSTLIAYELLFRSATEDVAEITDDRYATAKVITDALNAIGLDDLIGNKTAFINVDKSFLINPVIEAIPTDRFIFEILETVTVDNEVIERMSYLHKLGYTFALDDFDFSPHQFDNVRNILPYIHIVKIDLTTCIDIHKAQDQIKFLKDHKIELLAEKVETHTQYKECLASGFTYFQGYYFAKPDIIEGKKLSASKLTIITVIKQIIAKEDMKIIEQEISQSPEIAVSLLKYLNSASFGIKREIGSIKQAISLLGVKPLLRWVTLLLYAVPDKDDPFAKPLMETVLLRAELMKQLTLKISTKEEADKAYFVGLISMLDTILHKEIHAILKDMSFDEQINDAILSNNNLLGKTLLLTKSIQSTQDRKTMCDANETGISCADMAEILTTSYVNVMKLTQDI